MKKYLIVLMAVWFCSVTAFSQEFSGEDYGNIRPPYIPLSRLNYRLDNSTISFQKLSVGQLTSQEKTELDSAIGTLPKFGAYLFSGCHDRSQASYQLLPAELKNKAYKAWIFSPERHTSSISGRIKLRSNEEYAKQVDWGYHVALFFYDGNQKLILDQGLSPGNLVSVEEWFAKMNIPVGSFWTITNGDVYLFNSTEELRSPRYASPANQNIFNGYFHRYQSNENKYLSRNLARDDAGYMLMTQNGCPELKLLLSNPGPLGESLKLGRLPSSCQAVLAFYGERFRYWENLLEP